MAKKAKRTRKRSHEEHGSFQLSLGFIISVVFAIVLLSVAIVWLRGTIFNVEGLTDDLTQQAQQALRDTFTRTSTSFDIFPETYKLATGKTLVMQGGIRNTATDGLSHLYAINVRAESVSSNVCSNGLTCTAPGGKTLDEYMNSWVTFTDTAQRVDINQVGFLRISFSVPSEAVKGIYIFSITACYDKVVGSTPVASQCTPISDNIWGGSTKQVLIEVV